MGLPITFNIFQIFFCIFFKYSLFIEQSPRLLQRQPVHNPPRHQAGLVGGEAEVELRLAIRAHHLIDPFQRLDILEIGLGMRLDHEFIDRLIALLIVTGIEPSIMDGIIGLGREHMGDVVAIQLRLARVHIMHPHPHSHECGM